jgi:hypothetical protein
MYDFRFLDCGNPANGKILNVLSSHCPPLLGLNLSLLLAKKIFLGIFSHFVQLFKKSLFEVSICLTLQETALGRNRFQNYQSNC